MLNYYKTSKYLGNLHKYYIRYDQNQIKCSPVTIKTLFFKQFEMLHIIITNHVA